MQVRHALIITLVLGCSIHSQAADPGSHDEGDAARLPQGLNTPPSERLDDPPASIAALSQRASTAATVVQYGAFTSVQVNVDVLGNNILGDAANEPSMAIDPANPSRMAIGWRQFDTVLSNFRQAGVAHSTDGGRTWSFTGVLETNRFRSDPVLAADAFGNFFYSSLTRDQNDNFLVDVFRSTDGGASWDAGTFSYGGDKQWLVADGRSTGIGAGHIYQAWNTQFSCCGTTDFTRSTNSGSFFPDALNLPEPRMKWGTLDTDSHGVLYLAGAALNQVGHVFVRSFDAYNPAVTPTFDAPVYVNLDGFSGGFGGFDGPNPAGLLGQVWVAAHPSKPGHVYILASVNRFNDPCDVMFVRSVDGGETWSRPLRVNDDPEGNDQFQWFGTMSVAPNGRIDAVWNDTRSIGVPYLSAVHYSYSTDEGQTWSPSVQISPLFDSHAGFPQQNKMGDYSHMISDNGGASLAYAATFTNEQDVYFVRIPRDCNGNGIEDDCDTRCGAPGTRCALVGCGQRGDCNGNAVPDECEPNEDCNFNNQRDLCELLDTPELDCNANQVIDFCERNADCNNNGILDVCDLFAHDDCNENGVPDDCDALEPGADRNQDRIPDYCQGACCDCLTCTETDANQCFFRNGTVSDFGVLCGDQAACTPTSFAHNQCSQALEIPSVALYNTTFDNRCATTDGPPTVPCQSTQPFGADQWYTYQAPCTGQLYVSTCDQTFFDGMLAVYGGGETCTCPENNGGLLACGDDTCGFGGGPAYVDLPVIEGRCYTIRVGGWAGSIGEGTLTLGYVSFCRPTDLDGDADTDFADFARFQNCLGSLTFECVVADFDADGLIDLADYSRFQSDFGP